MMATEAMLQGGESVIHEAELPLEPREPVDEADGAMARYACGDGAAFSVVYDAICPEITRLLGRRLRNRPLVEDLVQETFVKMHKHRGSFLPGARVRPWAVAIAIRLCIDHFRREGSARRVFDDEGGSVDGPGNAPDPEEVLAGREMVKDLERELRALPSLHRDAFLLVRGEERSQEEAARLLGTTVTAIKLRVFRAASHLRKALGKRPGSRGKRQ